MKNQKNVRATKYALFNFHCGQCETGIVQQLQTWKRGGIINTTVSGCMDCGYEYGVLQSGNLKPLSKKIETLWP